MLKVVKIDSSSRVEQEVVVSAIINATYSSQSVVFLEKKKKS